MIAALIVLAAAQPFVALSWFLFGVTRGELRADRQYAQGMESLRSSLQAGADATGERGSQHE